MLLETAVRTPEVIALAAEVQQVVVEQQPLPHESPDRVEMDEPAAIEEHGATLKTQCGGLFYLLDRLQELDVPESLWKACLPEGEVLAASFSALLGPAFADDPAPMVIGGLDHPPVCPAVTPEQHAEVAIRTCAELALALPRRGLADIPPAVVTLADYAAGRLLIAAADESPYAFFAWPATSPALVQEGLRALLDNWPHRGILAADRALVELDASGRLRPRRDTQRVSLLLPEAPSAAAAALLAMVAGAPSLLFTARCSELTLARPARIRITGERIDVIFGPASVDLNVRRAGLDRDPGWLPWLRRRVRFIYEET